MYQITNRATTIASRLLDITDFTNNYCQPLICIKSHDSRVQKLQRIMTYEPVWRSSVLDKADRGKAPTMQNGS